MRLSKALFEAQFEAQFEALFEGQFEALFEGLDWRRIYGRRVRRPTAAE